MALSQTSMATASVKKILGFAHTDNAKGLGNEAYKTGFSVSGSTVFGADVPADPAKGALFDTTAGVVEYVRLQLIADPTSNGKAWFATIPTGYNAGSSNAKKALAYFADGSKLADSKGKVQIIPASFGAKYEPIPYAGGSAVKGSGTVIPPADARDWMLDVFNGIFVQQGSGSDTTPTFVECYVWIGGFLTDELAEIIDNMGSGTQTFIGNSSLVPATDDYYFVDQQTPANAQLSVAKWYISAQNGTRAQVTEVTALMAGSTVAFNEYGKVHVGQPLFQIKARESGGTIQLLAKPSVAGLTVEVKRLAVA